MAASGGEVFEAGAQAIVEGAFGLAAGRDDPVGTQAAGIQSNPDGSYDIYFAPEPPEGKAGNGLQTIPGKSWFAVLRMYGPEQAWIDKT